MAENTSPKKVITLDSMKVLVDKIKEDFATKEAVTQQIEILALFDDPPAQEGAE